MGIGGKERGKGEKKGAVSYEVKIRSSSRAFSILNAIFGDKIFSTMEVNKITDVLNYLSSSNRID